MPPDLTESLIEELLEELISYQNRPRDFCNWAFPWGEPGELETAPGLEKWQDRVASYIQERLEDYDWMPIKVAVASGHGIGKSCLVSMLNIWGFTTFEDTRGVITANTENQLKTKTWPELTKWKRLFIADELFTQTATAMFPKEVDATKEWRLDMVPWSLTNPDAFAGMHNLLKRIMFTFDEASQIPSIIWETAEGAETDADTQIIKLSFGNPTELDSYFYQCFDQGKFAKDWYSFRVDSREVRFTNKKKLESLINTYGIDHDVVRVRIRGEFPYQSGDSFISRELAAGAVERKPPPINHSSMVLGVDIARFGEDKTVIYPRKGLDAQTNPPLVYSGRNTLQVVTAILQAVAKYNPDTVFIDSGYIGASVLDILWNRRMRRPHFIAVDFGSKPDGVNEQDADMQYMNKRAEIWGAMRHWLARGCIVNEVRGSENWLVDELISPSFELQNDVKLKLESKKQMRVRGAASPDIADALALTFALPLNDTESEDEIVMGILRKDLNNQRLPDYDPFSEQNIYGDAA